MKMSPKQMLLIRIYVGFLLLSGYSCSQKENESGFGSVYRGVLGAFEPYPRDTGELELDRWYSIRVQDEPAGSMHLTITRHATPRGWRRMVVADERVVVQRAEHRMEISSRNVSLENDQGEMLRYQQVEQQAGGDKRVVEAGIIDKEMVTLRGPEIIRVMYEPDAISPQAPYRHVFSGLPLLQRKKLLFRSYSSQTASYVSNQLEMLKISDSERPILTTRHTIDAMPGMLILVDLDLYYMPVSMETSLGALRLKFTQVEQEPMLAKGGELPNLDSLLKVESNVKFDDRSRIATARYKISGLAKHVDKSWLTGPGQKAIKAPKPGTFILRVRQLKSPGKVGFPLGLDPADKKRFAKYLASSELAPIHRPEIKTLARKITAEVSDSWIAVRRLRDWVSQNIECDMGMAFASAIEVLRKRKGDCTEQSVLLTTLVRAVGIPARCVMGLVYQDGVFARHMWTEVWVDGWRSIDAAMQTDQLTAAWIRLGEHSLQLTDDKKSGLGGMLAFVSDLKVVVEAYTTDESSLVD